MFIQWIFQGRKLVDFSIVAVLTWISPISMRLTAPRLSDAESTSRSDVTFFHVADFTMCTTWRISQSNEWDPE